MWTKLYIIFIIMILCVSCAHVNIEKVKNYPIMEKPFYYTPGLAEDDAIWFFWLMLDILK